MRSPTIGTVIGATWTILLLGVMPGGLSAQLPLVDTVEARVWLDRDVDDVLQRGDDVRVYYRTSQDAWAAIFRIDTDGRIELLFPQDPGNQAFVAGGRDYRLLLRDEARWRVDDDPGLGYFFMVASPEPLDFSALGFEPGRGWDLGAVGSTVYEDPYVAIDDYVALLIPDWDVVPYGLDFLEYSVGERAEYPRFLCYDCHDAQPYARWNPYDDLCVTYNVVVWNDPWFQPRYRYSGLRVVYARPFGPRPRYGVTLRRPGTRRPVVVQDRVAPPRRTAVYKESPRASGRRVPPSVRGGSRAAPSRVQPSGRDARRPTPEARSGAVRRTPSGVRPAPGRPSGGVERGGSRATPGRGAARPPRAAPTLRRRPSERPAPARANGTGVRERTPAATGSRRPVIVRPPRRSEPATGRSGSGSAGRPSRPSAGRSSAGRSGPNSGRSRPSTGRSGAGPTRSPAARSPGRSGATGRAAPTRPGRASPGARPARPSGSSRPDVRPPGRRGGGSPAAGGRSGTRGGSADGSRGRRGGTGERRGGVN